MFPPPPPGEPSIDPLGRATTDPGVAALVAAGVVAAGVVAADVVAAAVLATPCVAGLHGGRFGEVATYLPRRRVIGVRLRPDTSTTGAVTRVEIHLVARYPATVAEITTRVRAAVRTVLADHPEPFAVTITVEDVVADHPAIGGPVGDRPVTDTGSTAVGQVVERVVAERAVITGRVVGGDEITEHVAVDHVTVGHAGPGHAASGRGHPGQAGRSVLG